ncbi:hypothetical protein KKF59_04470 [Patescibacteria group bacterium]|nr:hypothetical protein [Patescibacteria group bacterium]MBU1908349.1 hypothetical protein [Patescibacteria group bacterium]
MNLEYQISIPVTVLQEGKRFVAYSPALDISTAGKTTKEAKKRFGELVQIFFEEVHEMGTTDAVLKNLGWVKFKREWQPPRLVSQQTNRIKIPA